MPNFYIILNIFHHFIHKLSKIYFLYWKITEEFNGEISFKIQINKDGYYWKKFIQKMPKYEKMLFLIYDFIT